MLKLVGVIALGLLASAAGAQETYSVGPVSAQKVLNLTAVVAAKNVKTCLRLSTQSNPLTASCTQAQACTNANAPGGASCTPGQARTAGVRIWPATFAGREEYVTFGIADPAFDDQVAAVPGQTQRQACLAWQTQNQAARDAACVAHGITAPCLMYGSTCG